jgi:hypothetical protein
VKIVEYCQTECVGNDREVVLSPLRVSRLKDISVDI